tara:strand:+ start:9626 stop:10354 length:729 start_codon:yes stop_codon:yes gene_type:complete
MPKTYKTEIIGYTFEELNEDIQNSIYENDNCFADMIDLDHIEDDFKETISQLFGGIDIGTYYDISCTQGSGACCVADLDVDTILNTLLNNSKCHDGRLPIALHILREKHKNGAINIESIKVVRCGPSNFYSHEKTCCVEIKYTNYEVKGAEDIDEAIATIEEELTLRIRELLTDFHGNLESFYEDASSFEAYCEIMSDNDFNDAVYTCDGKVVDPVLIKHSYVIDGYQLPLDFDDYTEHSFT